MRSGAAICMHKAREMYPCYYAQRRCFHRFTSHSYLSIESDVAEDQLKIYRRSMDKTVRLFAWNTRLVQVPKNSQM
ncbi:hypothetical protein Mapa_006634 [Marchantia paleacea]|nr:hypothetical protein Mapa_006634 [Marchantia paleacea]